MKKVFIAYADEKMAYSLKRIGRQAKRLDLFDEVILYTPKSLPSYILESPLMQYSYGGGYWAWKPAIIWETLQSHNDGDVVCYIDAGCTVRKGIEWTQYFELMKKHDSLFFEYRDEMPIWGKFGSTSTKIENWTKKSAADYYDNYTGSNCWRKQNKIWGGAMLVKGGDNEIVKQWLDIVMNHPEVIIDPKPEDEQETYFAQHKHDQCTLAALVTKYPEHCIVLPELSETCGPHVSIYASRVRAKDFKSYLLFELKALIRRLLGNSAVDHLKELFR